MTVFLLYSHETVVGVFSTEEAAEKHAKEMAQTLGVFYYFVSEVEVCD